MDDLSALLKPSRQWRRAEVLAKPCPVPTVPGVYAWYFEQPPPTLPLEGCVRWNNRTLLYVGIAPSRAAALRPSKQTLRARIRNHYRGNAEGSTLRRTLGCLLADRLGTQLRRVGNGRRHTFADVEDDLSGWMEENAFVCWLPVSEPWVLEQSLLASVSLPLNLKGNEQHPFHPVLTAAREEARLRADALPVIG